MKAYLVSAAVAVAAVSLPAMAAPTFDPVGEFGSPTNFLFGNTNGGVFAAGTFQSSGCAIGGTSCYAQPNFQGVYLAPTDGTYQGAQLSASEITLHPGPNNGELATVRFIAPTAGSYLFSGFFRAADAPSGDGTTVFTPNGSSPLGLRGSANVTFNFRQFLAEGATADFSVGNGAPGSGYSFDTTGLGLSISAVPEPATWAMMILGFGFIGGAMRYGKRRSTVRFATS